MLRSFRTATLRIEDRGLRIVIADESAPMIRSPQSAVRNPTGHLWWQGLFCCRRIAAVEPVHHRLDPRRDEHLRRIGRARRHALDLRRFTLVELREHVIREIALLLAAPDADAQPRELVPEAGAPRELVDHLEPDVVPRALVFRAGIPKSDDRLHSAIYNQSAICNRQSAIAYFFFSSFLAGAAAASAPSSSFLPFLMTSGSAGVAVPPAATP